MWVWSRESQRHSQVVSGWDGCIPRDTKGEQVPVLSCLGPRQAQLEVLEVSPGKAVLQTLGMAVVSVSAGWEPGVSRDQAALCCTQAAGSRSGASSSLIEHRVSRELPPCTARMWRIPGVPFAAGWDVT